jgi:hypothetical protein
MLRFVYRLLLRLHPARFRDRFAEEMLAIFDRATKEKAKVGLLADGCVSVVRQWTLRSEYWEEKAPAPARSTSDGLPIFYTFESFKPRTSALIDGGILTIIVFYAVCLVLSYTWTHPVLIPFRGIQFQTASTVNQLESSSSLFPVEVTTIKSALQSASPQLGREPLKAVVPPRSPSSPQSRIQAALPDTLALNRLRSAAATHPIASPAVPSFSQSSVRAILPPVVSEEALRSYAGTYAADPPNELIILITTENGQLVIAVSGESKDALVPVSNTKFIASGRTNTSIEFVKDHGRAGYELNIYRDGLHITAHCRKIKSPAISIPQNR